MNGRMLRILVASAVGIAFPYGQNLWQCRGALRLSEACVWGRAYLPVTRVVLPLLVAPIVFLLLTLISRWRSQKGKG
jgi:hypothetical protein